MKILVCAATEMEMPDSIKRLPNADVLIHGVGAVQASYFLGKYLASRIPDMAIQIGLAGSYDPMIDIGEIVQVVMDQFVDLGSEDKDGTLLHLADLPFISKSNPFTSKAIKNENDILKLEYHKVRAITVNTTSGYKPTIDRMIKEYQPQIESMEGAVFFAAMEFNHIPCVQIRAISNKVEPRNRDRWNIPLAISELEKAMLQILGQILKSSY
jgi:futalosine hydrolase